MTIKVPQIYDVRDVMLLFGSEDGTTLPEYGIILGEGGVQLHWTFVDLDVKNPGQHLYILLKGLEVPEHNIRTLCYKNRDYTFKYVHSDYNPYIMVDDLEEVIGDEYCSATPILKLFHLIDEEFIEMNTDEDGEWVL
jgi:hypothetical protein